MGNYVKASGKRHGGKTAIVILSVIAVLLAAMVVAGVFVAMRYHIIDAKLYAKELKDRYTVLCMYYDLFGKH